MLAQRFPSFLAHFHPITVADEVMKREEVEGKEARAHMLVSDGLLDSCFGSSFKVMR